MKEKALKVGDEIRIINPVLVNRFGYPLNTRIIKNEFTLEQRKEVQNFFRKFVNGLPPLPIVDFEGVLDNLDYSTSPDGLGQVFHGLAYGILKAKGHGGNNRQLYTQEFPELSNGTARIKSRKVVKTGTRVAPSGGYCSYTGEYDYDPGYLANEKTHVLYEIDTVYLPTKTYFIDNQRYNISLIETDPINYMIIGPNRQLPVYIEKTNVQLYNWNEK